MSSCEGDKTCTCGTDCKCGSGCGEGKMCPESLVHGVGPQKTHSEGGAGEMNPKAENGGCKCNPCTCNPCTCK